MMNENERKAQREQVLAGAKGAATELRAHAVTLDLDETRLLVLVERLKEVEHDCALKEGYIQELLESDEVMTASAKRVKAILIDLKTGPEVNGPYPEEVFQRMEGIIEFLEGRG